MFSIEEQEFFAQIIDFSQLLENNGITAWDEMP